MSKINTKNDTIDTIRDQIRDQIIDTLFVNNTASSHTQYYKETDNNDNNINNMLLSIQKDIIELLTKKYNFTLPQIEHAISSFILNLKRSKQIKDKYNFKYIP